MKVVWVSDVSIRKEDFGGRQPVHVGRMNIRHMVFERH